MTECCVIQVASSFYFFLFLASEEIWWPILAWTLFLSNVLSYKKVFRESGLFKVWNPLCSISLLCRMVLNFMFSWIRKEDGQAWTKAVPMCISGVRQWGGGWQEKAVSVVLKVHVTPCTYYIPCLISSL